MTISKILASFVVKSDTMAKYQGQNIDLQEFSVLDDGTVRFRYYQYRADLYATDTVDTLLFQKIFSIDVSKLLT
jgi:hypothetical protein